MKIAVLGDVHGRFQAAAQLLQSWQEHTKQKIETVLQVGDLMPNRDAQDMEYSAAGEAKYRYPGDFHSYHEGQLKFPAPLLFIGGNHDPYNWLDTFPAGGWLNHWLYYLGRSVDTEHEGLNICGISGIYHPKKSPVESRSAMPVVHTAADRKAYTYMIEGEVEAMLEVEKRMPCDILLLHDWPTGLDRRPYVGNPLARRTILETRPPIVFCGHMHRFLDTTLGASRVICLNCVASPEEDQGTGAAMYVFDSSAPSEGTVWMGKP